MSPWYWAPIGLTAFGLVRIVYLLYLEDELGWLAGCCLLAALVWTVTLQAVHTHNPAPATTRVCTAQALEPVYSQPLKHTVPTWVCVGWSEN